MNLHKLNKLGYDSIIMRNISGGAEICLYKSHRVKIAGIVHWNSNSIAFDDIDGCCIELNKFDFLTKNRIVLFNEKLENEKPLVSNYSWWVKVSNDPWLLEQCKISPFRIPVRTDFEHLTNYY